MHMPNIEDIIEKLPSPPKKDVDLLHHAYDFALKAHHGQERKNGDPYFIHVFATAKYLAELGMSPTVIAAGFLHDVIEDTTVTAKDIEKEFGKEVLELVKGVTKLGTVKYKGVERNVENLRKFFVAMAADPRVLIIKLCDRLHNVQTLAHVREDKRERIAKETLEIYAPLANRLSLGKLKGALEDAAFPYAYPEGYEQAKKALKERKEMDEKHLIDFQKVFAQKLKHEKIDLVSLDHRVKHLYSLWKEMTKYDGDITRVHDIMAVRIIVKSIEDCYRVLGIIHGSWKPLPGRIKDYIAVPKANGYKSLHTTIFTKDGGIAEIQIRTQEMHEEAEFGIASHLHYKEIGKNKSKEEIEKKTSWTKDLLELQQQIEDKEEFLHTLKTDFFSSRVFVFTPKGDVVDLPEGSTPIDFAYAIHSKIGDKMSHAKVNGKMVSIDTVLRRGDVVEIVTNKNGHPTAKWLDHVKTSMAKRHIQRWIETGGKSL
jgi:GTP pyrophosphokinase